MLLPALLEASDAARAITRSGGKNGVKAWQRPATHRLYLPIDPLDAIKDEDKVAWLMRIDADTRWVLGPELAAQRLQCVVPRDCWQSAYSFGAWRAVAQHIGDFRLHQLP